jgi:hemolysin activation/secretion protein
LDFMKSATQSRALRLAAGGLVAACLAPCALAQIAPNAGSILQQVQPPPPAVPAPAAPPITVEDGRGSALPATAPFAVQSIRIVGPSTFDAATLHALVADGEGRSLALPQLQERAARITDFYRRQGYPLARAIVPAQIIRDGLVTIEVIEARYGSVVLANRSRVGSGLLQATLAPLHSGELVEQSTMDRALLLLADIPGVQPNAVFKPGARAGTTDLSVAADALPPWSASASVDNHGNHFTGRARAMANLAWANPLGMGDLLSLDALSSGPGLAYGRLAYESVVSGQGTRVGGGYSELRYELGEELAPLDAHGTAKVASAWLRQPLLRGRTAGIYAQLQHDRLRLRDHVDTTLIRSDRDIANTSLTLSGEANDGLQGLNAWSLGGSGGRISIDQAAGGLLESRNFSKANASYSRLQGVGLADALSLSVLGQWTGSNLDSWSKLSVGGPASVRAYEVGVLSGDSGYQATLEFRHAFAEDWYGRWQGLAFVDTAYLKINTSPAPAVSVNTARLSGAGFGLNWAGPDRWRAKTSVAKPIGAEQALLAGRQSTRVWVELAKAF